MSELRNGNLILSKEASKNLIKNLIHPNQRAWEKKEKFLDNFKDATMEMVEDGTIVRNIPSLNIPMREKVNILYHKQDFEHSIKSKEPHISITYTKLKDFNKNVLSRKDKEQYNIRTMQAYNVRTMEEYNHRVSIKRKITA